MVTIHQHYRQTDRQTDVILVRYSRHAYTCCAKTGFTSFVINATAMKWRRSKFCPKILRTEAIEL